MQLFFTIHDRPLCVPKTQVVYRQMHPVGVILRVVIL